MATILDEIVEHKRTELVEAKRRVPLDELRRRVESAPAVRDFVDALRTEARRTGIALIAEVKKASPSAGLIRDDFDPLAIARTYQRHGAACISCLTDERFFQGRLEYLQAIRQAVELPVLRKDFIIDEYQIWEARAAGADCVLLIAECLDDALLHRLYRCTRDLGMHALIEIYEADNLDRVLRLDPPLIGINNRDLKSFTVDLEHSIRLGQRLPPATVRVSESGIYTRDDVVRLQKAGFHAMLVGESLMRHADIGAKVDELLGR
ncbi:MAG: indole-3-glycerol phosphate synthase TrpC [Planctomycetes bacterium]|nr:indole-3-glycerol phosphate synthase TrpC [Planctomycetota bacterium]